MLREAKHLRSRLTKVLRSLRYRPATPQAPLIERAFRFFASLRMTR